MFKIGHRPESTPAAMPTIAPVAIPDHVETTIFNGIVYSLHDKLHPSIESVQPSE